MLDYHYVLPFISILPRILIVAHSTLQKRVSSYSALQLQCQLLVNHLCTKIFLNACVHIRDERKTGIPMGPTGPMGMGMGI
jgi:hypothetical protein